MERRVWLQRIEVTASHSGPPAQVNPASAARASIPALRVIREFLLLVYDCLQRLTCLTWHKRMYREKRTMASIYPQIKFENAKIFSRVKTDSAARIRSAVRAMSCTKAGALTS